MGFGEILKQKMSDKHIKQAELADAIGLPRTTLSSILSRDSSKVEIDVFLKMCEYLDCDPEEFYDEFNKKNKKETVKLTKEEEQLIAKYQALDSYGKQLIDATVSIEYSRCTADNEPKLQIKHSFYKVSAGLGYGLEDSDMWEIIDIPDTPEARRADFALTIQGDSMEPIYFDGDIVLVKQQEQLNTGEIGIFVVNGDGFIKKLGKNRLISLNAVYEDIYLSENDRINCIGKVIGRV